MIIINGHEGPYGYKETSRFWRIRSVSEVEKTLVELERVLKRLPQKTASQLLASACEALNNALERDAKFPLGKTIYFMVTFSIDRVEMVVEDQGEGLVLLGQDPPVTIRTPGRGLPIMRMPMDRVEWYHQGKQLIMVKYIDEMNESKG